MTLVFGHAEDCIHRARRPHGGGKTEGRAQPLPPGSAWCEVTEYQSGWDTYTGIIQSQLVIRKHSGQKAMMFRITSSSDKIALMAQRAICSVDSQEARSG